MQQLSQAEAFLLQQIRQGDRDAWARIVQRFEGRLRAFARQRLVNATDAEDVVQETFLGLLQSLGNFRGHASLETFLFGILRRRIIDLYRRQGSRPELPACDLADPSPAEQPAESTEHWVGRDATASWYARRDEEQAVMFHTLGQAVLLVTDGLTREQNLRDLMVAEMAFFAQLRNKQIAWQLELTENQVALVKHRLLQRLKQAVQNSSPTGDARDTPVEIPDNLLTHTWEQFRPSCPKRTTIGKYLLDTLSEEWQRFVTFHLDELGCRFCLANRDDLLAAQQRTSSDSELNQRIFQSTVGFLRHEPRHDA